jgi:2-methylcitrate dehydratase PrpD
VETAQRDFARIDQTLGERWESRNSSFKPFPAAHVIHPYLSAALRLRERYGIAPGDIQRIECPVAGFIVGIVCEPRSEKLAPATQAHGRVSLPYSVAEALCTGKFGKDAYSAGSRNNPEILALARKVEHYADPDYPGPGRFKGVIKITMQDGRVFEEIEEYNRGSAENPMSYSELRAKFEENAAGFLGPRQCEALASEIARLEELQSARTVVDLACGRN